MLTQDQIQKIRSAIAECDRYIAKEGARNPDLRPSIIADVLRRYREHKAMLLGMLKDEGVEA